MTNTSAKTVTLRPVTLASTVPDFPFVMRQQPLKAAEQVGVKLIAYTSILYCDRSPMQLADEHKATESLLNTSPIDSAVLRHGWYNENYTKKHSCYSGYTTTLWLREEGCFASASRRDYAAVAAVVLTSENQAGKVYELAGYSSFNLSEFAA